MAASRARRGPHGPRSVGEKPRVPARPVPSGKGDARPIGLGLGRKTRDPTGPTRSGGSGKRTPLPGRASGPPAPPPRSRPSPVPREGKTSRPSPQTPRQEAADAAPHFTFCSFNFGGGTLAASLAPDCSAPSGAAEALLAPPGSPAGPRSRAPPPPVSPSVPSLHQPRAGAEPPPPLPSPPHAGGRCIERPGLCQVVAPPPLVGLHTKRLRGSRRRRRPPRSGAGAGGAEEEQPPRGETRGECALGGETLPLSVWPRKSSLREGSSGSVCARVRPGPPRPARPHLPPAGSADRDPDAPRSGARPAVRAPGSRPFAHTPAGHASGARARESRARASLPPLPPPAVPPPPSGPRRARAGRTAPPPGWRQDLPCGAPLGGLAPKGKRRRGPCGGKRTRSQRPL